MLDTADRLFDQSNVGASRTTRGGVVVIKEGDNELTILHGNSSFLSAVNMSSP